VAGGVEGRAAGLPVAVVSRVGADQLGAEALRLAARYGLATDLVQVDPVLPTGVVRVTLDARGEATFDIVSPAAWDAIESTPLLLRRAADARAIVFGTVAQRHAVSRETVERMLDAARGSGALVVFDANLRAPHDDREVVERSLRGAGVVKVTDEELSRFAQWFGVGRSPGTRRSSTRRMASALAETFGIRAVCVTRGGAGAALWRDGEWTEHPGFEVDVRDTVGAGDAFLAVLVSGLLTGVETRALLQHANLLGAYVATQSGAVPGDQPAMDVAAPDTAGAVDTGAATSDVPPSTSRVAMPAHRRVPSAGAPVPPRRRSAD